MSTSGSASVRRTVGRNIAERRRALAWTQEHLAERLGVTPRYVQAVEGGDENLTINSMCRIASILRTTFAAIVAERGKSPPTKRTSKG